MSRKSNYEDKLDKLYKELFDAQFYHEDPIKEQDVLNRIKRLEKDEGFSSRAEGDATLEAYRESVRSDAG